MIPNSPRRAALASLVVLALAAAPALAQRAVLPPGAHTNAMNKIGNDSISTIDMHSLTPAQLAQTLLGSGVTISNVVYSGAPLAAGVFTGGSTPIGFQNGIILSSGDIASVPGPNTSDSISTDTLTPGDPVMTSFAGSPTFNATSLDFDFVVTGSTQLSFQYVFSSDEYNEFVNSQFNDVFAFFLNGQNIALLPNGNEVSINNVNCGNPYHVTGGHHCELFINNDCSDIPGAAHPCAGNVDTEMDGLTVVLTATGQVNPGVNHIRLIVADAGDPVYDTNVFIRAASFGAGTPAPFFETPSPCGAVLHTQAGTPVGYTMVAKAATGLPANQVTLQSTALPAGASHTPPLPVLGIGQNATATTVFAWTPTVADIGTHQIVYTAVDQLGQITPCTVTISVDNAGPVTSQDYLIIGFAPMSLTVPGSNGRLLLDTADFIILPVTQNTLPEWTIPPQASGFHLFAQFGSMDPAGFPADPIVMSNGIDIHIGVGWTSYGPTNMGISAGLEDLPLVFEAVSFFYEIERD